MMKNRSKLSVQAQNSALGYMLVKEAYIEAQEWMRYELEDRHENDFESFKEEWKGHTYHTLAQLLNNANCPVFPDEPTWNIITALRQNESTESIADDINDALYDGAWDEYCAIMEIEKI